VAIVDRREMEFDPQTVRLVLEWSPRAALAFGLPPLKPESVRCKPTEGVIEVSYGDLSSTRVFVLRAEALGAMLIAYCNRCGIPVPRSADKAVRIERERVVMVFTLRITNARPPTMAEAPLSRLPEAVRAWSWIESSD
jgi:hypothetical protein